MRVISYNVNGIRAAMGKGLFDWLRSESPDVLCLQEIKASPEQVGVFEIEEMDYHHYWFPAEKKGYSGVAIFTKEKPLNVAIGCGQEEYDREGRVIRADYKDFSVMSVYHPSGSSGDERQAFKMKWLEFYQSYIANLKRQHPGLVLSGDFNICHRPIDIHNPKSNANTSGFLPEEREWMENFLQSGFIDSFRQFNAEPHQYSWWSYRAGSRGKNLGWRIDYNLVSEALAPRLKAAAILPQVMHSDHCPVSVTLD